MLKSGLIISISIYVLCSEYQQVIAENMTKTENYTPGVLSKLKQLRGAMKNTLEEADEFTKTDGHLIRWLKAAKMDINDAKERLEKAIKWRAENDVRNILNKSPIEELVLKPFYTIDGVGREGHPVVIFEMKKFDLKKLILDTNTSTIHRVFIQMFERMENKIYRTYMSKGEHISQGIVIADVSGYSVKQHGCIPCLSFYSYLTRTYEDLYPGLCNKIIVINASRIFLPIIHSLKPIMTEQSRNALDVYGSDKEEWEPKLLQLISADQLPVKLGGTRKTI